MIPDDAVEAAAEIAATRDYPAYMPDREWTREILEAASPHILAWDSAKIDAIRHYLRGENWAQGSPPKSMLPILDIINEVSK